MNTQAESNMSCSISKIGEERGGEVGVRGTMMMYERGGVVSDA